MMRSASCFLLVGVSGVCERQRWRMATRQANSPSNYINARPHSLLEQLDGCGFANTTCAADEDGDEVLDSVALCVTGPHGLAGNHLKGRAGEEEVGHGIDGRTVSTTQSERRVKLGG
jgi:hypothetical protein